MIKIGRYDAGLASHSADLIGDLLGLGLGPSMMYYEIIAAFRSRQGQTRADAPGGAGDQSPAFGRQVCQSKRPNSR